MWVNMAFGQTALSAFYSWGVAPGYGDEWPSAKRTRHEIAYREIAAVGQIDPLQFAVSRTLRLLSGRGALVTLALSSTAIGHADVR